jgi:hypothetical protein
MTFASRSVFFSVLCLSLMSFSCASGLKSESKEDEFRRQYLEQSSRAAVAFGVEQCSVRRLSPSECEKLKDEYVERSRTASQEHFLDIEKECKEYRLSEVDCDAKKEKSLKKVSEWRR